MQRTALTSDHSMLFIIFPGEDLRRFWVKNSLIPLDILHVDGNRRLVPPCKAYPCPSYPSNRLARYVWELPAGTAAKIGVAVGDELSIEGGVGPVH